LVRLEQPFAKLQDDRLDADFDAMPKTFVFLLPGLPSYFVGYLVVSEFL
jgi:hypothetical protein